MLEVMVCLVILFIVLVAFYELFRRSHKATLIFFTVIPIFAIPYWFTVDEMNDWFRWIKVISMIAGSLLVLATRTKFKGNRTAHMLINALIALNILEAVIKDFTTLDIGSIPNIVSGVVLMITLFKGYDTMYVEKETGYGELYLPQINFYWALWYTIWNFSYIYSSYPDNVWRHIVVLGIPLFLTFVRDRNKTWLQCRAYTLVIYLLFSYSFPWILDQYNPPLVYNGNVYLIMGIISIISMLIYFIDKRKSDKLNGRLENEPAQTR